jgi:hypothetical protein
MAKNDPSEIATWTGQGVAHYSDSFLLSNCQCFIHTIICML